MFIVIGIMALGIAAGYLLRNRNLKRLGNVISVLIWLLLFLLGVEAGSDERIVKGIASLGGEALVISAAGVAGSSLFAMVLWKMTGGRRKAAQEKKGGEE